MYCSNCGNKLEEGTNFCPSCGSAQEQKNNKENEIGVNNTINELKEEARKRNEKGNLYKIIGWVSAALSLIFFPIVFGALAVIMGYLYRDYEEKQGTIIMIVGVATAIFGMVIGASVGFGY